MERLTGDATVEKIRGGLSILNSDGALQPLTNPMLESPYEPVSGRTKGARSLEKPTGVWQERQMTHKERAEMTRLHWKLVQGVATSVEIMRYRFLRVRRLKEKGEACLPT